MRRKPSKTRIVRYSYEADFIEGPVDDLLWKAREQGIVTMHDTGRGRIVWFEGPPGKRMRELRERIKRMIGVK